MSLKSRLSSPIKHNPAIAKVAQAVNSVNDGVIPQTTADLMGLRVGQIVGSSYLTSRIVRESENSKERLDSVATWWDATCFTDAERAALALAEAVHTPATSRGRVSDELYAEAAKHYDEREITTITAILGQIGYFIPLALIGLPIPGVSPAEQWTD
ncbi:carboxymuconolactone decarboxylase family protein [Glycomyces buryatensis]|uniref:Carboxymuconolactone decarboxylase family protein n=1 Tax=Glycomyces buryatensis TaxID=2570927 RepID=A0A4S8QDZ4_9ACTN|nr:carboxymuconolactone decarboxylase family protein [Glycomyces buryatensis]THV42793.1 carboxymuconolactone decarboxylase family protein [Glycomyces buryatensis]